jgi:hypothetical protein
MRIVAGGARAHHRIKCAARPLGQAAHFYIDQAIHGAFSETHKIKPKL